MKQLNIFAAQTVLVTLAVADALIFLTVLVPQG
jgi:hypothetical protein